jgi:hypothetical protein
MEATMPALDPPATPVEARRAPRFSIVAPVRFRAPGCAWLEGTTVSVSRVGLLIRTAHEAPPPTAIVELFMTLGIPGSRGCAKVACTGRVVSVAPSSDAGETFLATTIDEFQIEPAAHTEEQIAEFGVVEKWNQQGDQT